MKSLTIYPRKCAMHGAVEFHTRRWGWVVVYLPFRTPRQWGPWGAYASPDATPSEATWKIGPRYRDARHH